MVDFLGICIEQDYPDISLFIANTKMLKTEVLECTLSYHKVESETRHRVVQQTIRRDWDN